MVTIAYITILTALSLLVGAVDSYLYKSTLLEALYNLYSMTPGTRRWIVFLGAFIGFMYSIVTDFRLQKHKRKKSVTST